MISYYVWLLIFGIILYAIAIDQNVAIAVDHIITLTKISFRRNLWWLKNNPRNPIVKYLMWRRSMKLAEKILKTKHNETSDKG